MKTKFTKPSVLGSAKEISIFSDYGGEATMHRDSIGKTVLITRCLDKTESKEAERILLDEMNRLGW